MASLSKLIKKFKKVQNAVNSFKGISGKLRSINYDGVISNDILADRREDARNRLDQRRESLKASFNSANAPARFASLQPNGNPLALTYPLHQQMMNSIEFRSLARNAIPKTSDNTEGGISGAYDFIQEVSIMLYIPDGAMISDIEVSAGKQDFGLLARGADSTVGAFRNEGVGAGFSQLGRTVSTAISSGLNTLGNKMTGGYSNFRAGKAKNPMEEMQFQGIEFRSHSFSFEFIPASAEEARQVELICHHFKMLMLPNTFRQGLFGRQDSGAEQGQEETLENFFNYPNKFQIDYHGPIKNHVEGFLPCFLTKASVKYADDYTMTYHDGYPIKTTLDLSFTEVVIASQENYKEYISVKRGGYHDFQGTQDELQAEADALAAARQREEERRRRAAGGNG